MILFKEKNSTIETNFDQYSNKVLMFQTVKGVDEETVTKYNNIPLTREPTDSPLLDNFEYSDDIDTLLIIEADAEKKSKIIAQLKDSSLFLVNYVESNLHYNLIEKI